MPLLHAVGAAAIALTGPGAYSLDALLGLTWPAAVSWIALGLGVFGGFANLAVRKAEPSAAAV